MDSRWARVKAIFEDARSRERADQPTLLDERCGLDGALRTEVEQLLAADRAAGGFLEGSAAAAAFRCLEQEPDLDTVPGRLGVWRILRKIGQGGMSSVYLVERADGLFQKRAALKILKGGMFGTDVRRRFAHERQILADLDHPGIVRLLDGGVAADGRPFLVMEYVEGESLTDYLRNHRCSEKHKLELLLELCDAVAYAHRRSFVHRDLKPSNILVTDQGATKLLDFGIAKILETSGNDGWATRTSARCLTPEYASPEQVRGDCVGPATDVYALGLILCRMLLGRHPYPVDGLSPYEVERAVCEQAPDLEGLSPVLTAVLARALEKNPSLRYATVEQFADQVRKCLRSSSKLIKFGAGNAVEPRGSHAGAARLASWPWNFGLFTSVLVGLSVVIGAPRLPFERGAPEYRLQQLTFSTGGAGDPVVSRDGKWLAYHADRSSDPNTDIWIQPLKGTQQPIRLTTHPATDHFPDLSPDGSRIVFRSFRNRGGLYLLHLTTGREEALGWDGFQPRFSPDGESISYAVIEESGDATVEVFSLRDGARRRVAEGLRNTGCAIWSPDGQRLMFVGAETIDGQARYDWWTVAVNGPRQRPVPTGAAAELKHRGLRRMHSQVCPGDWDEESVVFGFFAQLWRAPVDRSGVLTGPAQRLITSPAGIGAPRFVKRTMRPHSIVYHVYFGGANIWSRPLNGPAKTAGELKQLTDDRTIGGQPALGRPSLSADGTRLAYLSQRTGAWEVIIKDLETGAEAVAPAAGGPFKRRPILNSDGKRVAYFTEDGSRNIVWVADLETRNSRIVCADCGELKDWSRDEKHFLLISGNSLILRGAGGELTRTILNDRKYAPQDAALSHDGKWVALVAGVAGKQNLVGMVMPAAGGSESQRFPITEEPYSLSLHWAPDGDLLYFFQRREDFRCLWAQRLNPRTKRPIGAPVAVEHFHWSQPIASGHGWVSATRRRLAFNLSSHRSDIWMAVPAN